MWQLKQKLSPPVSRSSSGDAGSSSSFLPSRSRTGAHYYPGLSFFADWHNELFAQGVKLVSVSEPWNCENVAGPSGNNEAWKCANASVNLQKNHFLPLAITLEFPEDYEHQFVQNCIQIGSGYIPKKCRFKASAADCATVTVANPFPSSFKAARARSGRLSFKDRKKGGNHGPEYVAKNSPHPMSAIHCSRSGGANLYVGQFLSITAGRLGWTSRSCRHRGALQDLRSQPATRS